MAEVLKMRFLIRCRTAAEWTALNEILLASTSGTGAREMGVETDTGKFKLGDGATEWNALPYLSFGSNGFIVKPVGTSYTPVLGDDGNTILSQSATAFTLNIPTNASVAFPVGTKIAYSQGAAGIVTVSAVDALTTTIHAANGNVTGAQWDGGVAEKIGTDEWQLWNGPALGPLATAADAPGDGKQYARKNAGWWEIATSGGIGGVNEQVDTTYTLVLDDASKAIRCTNAAAVALTIPTNASVALPVLTFIPVFQGGAGVVTISGAGGVTLEAPNGAATNSIGDFRTLFQRDVDKWVIG